MRKRNIFLLLILAFLQGSLYAFLMPPWSLLDEEQHIDYILKISETGKRPVVGVDLLDKNIISSVIVTQRHAKFHWSQPDFSEGGLNTLEGYSYEGFQGPLFYYFSAPIFILVSGNVLEKLIGNHFVD